MGPLLLVRLSATYHYICIDAYFKTIRVSLEFLLCERRESSVLAEVMIEPYPPQLGNMLL